MCGLFKAHEYTLCAFTMPSLVKFDSSVRRKSESNNGYSCKLLSMKFQNSNRRSWSSSTNPCTSTERYEWHHMHVIVAKHADASIHIPAYFRRAKVWICKSICKSTRPSTSSGVTRTHDLVYLLLHCATVLVSVRRQKAVERCVGCRSIGKRWP